MDIDFEWDERKAERNYAKHRVHFRQAAAVFFDPFRIEADDPSTIEERFRVIGMAYGHILFVVYTWRSEAVRIISARKATNNERRRYYQN